MKDAEDGPEPLGCGQLPQPDFRLLFQAAPGLHLVLAADLRIVAVSDAYLRATMTTREEILGRDIFDVFPDNPDDATADGVGLLRDSLQRVIATGKTDVMSLTKYDIRRPESEGGEFELRYWSPLNTPVFDRDGSLAYIIHRVEDVTDFVKLRASSEQQERLTEELVRRTEQMEVEIYDRSQDLRKANRELFRANIELNAIRQDLERRIEVRTADLQRRNHDLEEIAYAASHDLQEPLRAVAGYCQLLQMDFGEQLPPDAADYVQKAIAGPHRMSTLIKGVLAFARVHRDALPLQMVDCNDVLADVLEGMTGLIDESRAVIESQDLPVLPSEPTLLTQLFQNLLVNAIKYRSEYPLIVRVSALWKDDQWLFSVADNGIGIPAESRERIFAMFQRLHTRDDIPGTGLGLALCRQIVDRHGGKIWVEGGEPDGSVFRFTLPAGTTDDD